jgi:DNA topoisomerase-1
VLAACALCGEPEGSTKAAIKRLVAQAVGQVAERLGNTKAVCRKCYIHPAVIEAFVEGDTIAPWTGATGGTRGHQLSTEEAAVVRLLTMRLASRTRRKAA